MFIFILQAIPLKVNGEETIRQKFEKESIMYQICNQVKELIILTIPMEKQLKIIDDGMKKISNTN